MAQANLAPQFYLGSEPSRIRGALADLTRIIDASHDTELFRSRMDHHAADVIKQLEHAVKRIRQSQTALEAERAIERGNVAELRRVA